MSHVAVVDVKILDLKALKAACAELGLEFREGQRTYRWYGQWMNDYASSNAAYKAAGIDPKDYGKCEHAIGIPKNKQAYEVGVVKAKDGKGYNLVWDFWSGGYGLQAAVGNNCNKLREAYSKHAARNLVKAQAVKFGYMMSEKVNEATGETEIYMTKY